MKVLEMRAVSKFYDEFKAVDKVSFDIEKGKMFGLLGPNGAGKTTTMRMIMNIIMPDEGEIKVLGNAFSDKTKNQVGYLPEERGLYPKMKLLPHLTFLGEMKGLNGKAAKRLSEEWLEKFELGKWKNNKVQDLSKGMQQKVQFIGTIMHSPDLLIVDEPFSGLDPVNAKFLKDILLQLKSEGKTIILSTHLMDQAEKLCDEICLLNRGGVVLKGPINEVKKKYSRNNVILEYSGDANFVNQLEMVKSTDDYGNYMEIRLTDRERVGDLFRDIAKNGLNVKKFEAAETSLNDIFIDIIGGQNNAENN